MSKDILFPWFTSIPNQNLDQFDPLIGLKSIKDDDTSYYDQQQQQAIELTTMPPFTSVNYAPLLLHQGSDSIRSPSTTKIYPTAYTSMFSDQSVESNISYIYPEAPKYFQQTFTNTATLTFNQMPIQVPDLELSLNQSYDASVTGLNYTDTDLLSSIEQIPSSNGIKFTMLYPDTIHEPDLNSHTNLQIISTQPLTACQRSPSPISEEATSPVVSTTLTLTNSPKSQPSKVDINKRKPNKRRSKRIVSSAAAVEAATRAFESKKSTFEEMYCPFVAEGMCTHIKPFNRSFNLRVHIKSHSEERSRSFECDICGRCYYRINELRRHRRSKHDI
ncbi:hypothetical protein HK098_007512 [Nowakowskiella sp. JEL0407]|nr:hypothetical protein HK098_007512 [Nowakowskiella sp. JEL0407]